MPIHFTQYDGQALSIEQKPKNIVSLVPSITETLLQWDASLLAKTSFCIYPKNKVEKINVIGGTKTPNIKKIIQLKPDLIIANKEENTQDAINELKKNCPVWVTYPQNFESTLIYLQELAQLAKNSMKAQADIAKLQKIQKATQPNKHQKNIACFIWKDPWMVAAKDTYIDFIISRFANNGFKSLSRYPQVKLSQLIEASIDDVILLTEPFTFTEKEKNELNHFFAQNNHKARVHIVDGEDMTWPGPRLANAFEHMRNIVSCDSSKVSFCLTSEAGKHAAH